MLREKLWLLNYNNCFIEPYFKYKLLSIVILNSDVAILQVYNRALSSDTNEP